MIFWYIESIFHSWNKSHLVAEFVSIWLKIYASVFMKGSGLYECTFFYDAVGLVLVIPCRVS